MERIHRCTDRPAEPVRITAVKPLSREERDFSKSFAHAISHATAAVAADPEMTVSAESLADRIRKAYSGFRRAQQPAIQRRARAVFSGSHNGRQRYFGAYADRPAAVWSTAEPGLDSELKQQLKQAVRARLDAQRDEIAEKLAVGIGAEFFGSGGPVAKTMLEVGHFSGDVQAAWTELTITSPINIELRWHTNAANAELGVWQLFRTGQSGQTDVLLATGNAGKAPGAIFTIDLGKHLPSSPPDVQATYLIRVTPKTATKVVQGSTPGQTGKSFGKAVGPPSNDVVITYSAITSPGLKFNIFDIYHAVYFNLDSFEMIQDQVGPGVEEFHVSGFVQEIVANSSEPVEQRFFGPKSFDIDPDGDRTKYWGSWEGYFLPKPDVPGWPRAYIGAFSVLEEDDGGSLSEWQSQVAAIAEAMVDGEVSQEVKDFLEEQFKDYIGDNIGQIITQVGSQVAETVLLIISETILGVVGAVVAAATFVISAIVSGMGDEFYGTQPFVFVLPTNITDYVHSLPGQSIAGGYRLDAEALDFKGSTSWPEATPYDGRVRLWFYWQFGLKEQS